MDRSFDAYRKWLGIPPEDQPPNHYRLLAIEPFEADPDVIANAADGRMAQVKNFQTGKHAQLSQRILNEIAAAKVCLLNPQKKAEYDRQLESRLKADRKAAPKASPPKPRKPEPKAAATPAKGIPAIETASVLSYVSARSRKRRPWQVPVGIGVGVVSLVAGSIFVIQRVGSPAREELKPAEGQANDRPGENRPPEVARVDPHEDVPPAGPKADVPPAEPPANPPDAPIEQPAEPDTPPPEEDPGRSLADLIDPPDPGEGAIDLPGPRPPGPDQPPSTPAGPKILPVPDQDARQAAEKRVQGVFGKELAAATTPEKKLALAEKLAKQAEETRGDPAGRFALMQLASETGAEAGELTMTLDIVDRMQRLYDIDALKVKAYLLDKVIGAGRSGPLTPAACREIVDAAMQLAQEAVAEDKFEMAGRFPKLAASAARKAKETALVRWIAVRGREIDRLEQRFTTDIKQTIDALAENPDDGEANLTAGRWYCFSTGNWDKGLPLLAKGSDAALAKLAQRDIAGPEDPGQQMSLADQWWDLARKEKGFEQRGIQARAQLWYECALPGLTGLDKAKVTNRLNELAAAAEPYSSPKSRGIIQPGNVALATNGTTVTGVRKGAGFLLDGNSTNYRMGQGLAHSQWPCEWIITFNRVYRLKEIRVKLYDTNPQLHYRYSMEISADGKEYTQLVDRSQGQWVGWQQMCFSPRPVKAIKFLGLNTNRGAQNFYVVELEAYCIPPAMPPR